MTSLDIGLSGILAAQRGLEVTAHNLANVNTVGFSRQRVEQAERPTIGDSYRGIGHHQGTEVLDVVRLRDELGDSAFRSGAANAAAADVRAGVTARAELMLGPIGDNALDALTEFWSAWEQLSIRPDDATSRQVVLRAGSRVVEVFQSASDTLEGIRTDASVQLRTVTDEVNGLAEQVAALNGEITEANALGRTVNDLLDRRDRLIDQLAAEAGVTVSIKDDQSATIFIGPDQLVSGNRPSRLELDPSGTSVVFAANEESVGAGGRLGQLQATASNALDAWQGELDAVADDIIDRVNTAHAAGFDLSGAPGGEFFDGTGARGIALAETLDTRGVAASASGAALDGNHALRMSEIGLGNTSPDAALRSFAGRLGAEAASAAARADVAELNRDGLEIQRSQTNGVSVDEELINMVRYQRAYEASARVLTAADEMLDRLINGTGLVGR